MESSRWFTAMWKVPLGCGKHNDQPDLGCQQFQMGCQSAGLEGKEEEAVIWALEKKKHYASGVSEFALPSPLLGGAGGICRLRSGVKFSADEERLLIELRGEFGKKWARKATRGGCEIAGVSQSRKKKKSRQKKKVAVEIWLPQHFSANVQR
ncbi:hypothetical protein Tco_0110962 [Tanacetum coccineum]